MRGAHERRGALPPGDRPGPCEFLLQVRPYPECEVRPSGACLFACTPGYADCDLAASNGCEVDVLVDAANCGACGVACASGQTCTAGACVSPRRCVVDDNASDMEVFAETGGAAVRSVAGSNTQISNPIGSPPTW